MSLDILSDMRAILEMSLLGRQSVNSWGFFGMLKAKVFPTWIQFQTFMICLISHILIIIVSTVIQITILRINIGEVNFFLHKFNCSKTSLSDNKLYPSSFWNCFAVAQLSSWQCSYKILLLLSKKIFNILTPRLFFLSQLILVGKFHMLLIWKSYFRDK